MKRVHFAATLLDAQLAVDALASLGIVTHIFNANAAGFKYLGCEAQIVAGGKSIDPPAARQRLATPRGLERGQSTIFAS